MIKGIGIDIVKNSRFENKEISFLSTLFTQSEIKMGEERRNKSEYYSSRFAVKEAVVKALGTGFTKYSPLEIEVYEECDVPKVKIKGVETSIYISLSHEKEFSVAIAILEEK